MEAIQLWKGGKSDEVMGVRKVLIFEEDHHHPHEGSGCADPGS
jgi:hypothetical protein